MLKIAVDVGGVLSKYPRQFKKLLDVSYWVSSIIQIYIVSDMHPQEKIQAMLQLNGIHMKDEFVISADYENHGENCKAIVCKKLGIDILIDDFVGYVASGDHIRLLVMPNPDKDYYSPDWKTDGTEGNFGRRRQK